VSLRVAKQCINERKAVRNTVSLMMLSAIVHIWAAVESNGEDPWRNMMVSRSNFQPWASCMKQGAIDLVIA